MLQYQIPCITFLKDCQLPEFRNLAATTEFLVIIDRLFDIFNSRSPAQKGWKSPIWRSNQDCILNFLHTASNYIQSLKTANGVQLIRSRRKMWGLGYISNSKALELLSNDWFKNSSRKYLLTYNLSQDPLEHLFGEIRQKGGFNNNPDSEQFRTAFRAIMANRTSNLGCATILSHFQLPSSAVSNCFMEEVMDNPDIPQLQALSDIGENVVAYISGYIAFKLIPRLQCTTCKEALISEQYEARLLSLVDRGGLYLPSRGLCRKCRICEQTYKSFSHIALHRLSFQTLVKSGIHNAIASEVFQSLICETSLDNNHRYMMVRQVAMQYMRIKLLNRLKELNRANPSSRSLLTKKILFLGQ